jgi:hypothetical protein
MDDFRVRKIRFAVGTSEHVRSSFWFVACKHNCVYVGARSLRGALKATFHGSRKSHVRFGCRSDLRKIARKPWRSLLGDGGGRRAARDHESGNGAWPMVESTQLGRRSVAPRVPHLEHRVLTRSTSLVMSSP